MLASIEKSTLKEDLLFTGIGIAILTVCLWQGIGITFDSHLYLLGGAYLLEYGVDDIFSVPAFRAKPPGLSALYALLQISIPLIKIANILFLAGTLLVNYRLVNILISEVFFRRFIKALMSVATVLLFVHNFLWTEPFFIFILSLYYFYSYKVLTVCQSSRGLYLLPVFGLLLIGLRHIGFVFTLVGSVYLFFNYKRSDRKQFTLLLLNIILPFISLSAWHWGLLLNAPTTEGYNITEGLDIWRNFLLYADVLKVWLIPPGLPLPELLSIVSVIFYLIVAALAVKQSYNSDKRHLVLLFVTSVAAYVGLMLLKGDLLIDDRERYLSVIYAPLLVLVVYVLSNRIIHTTINRKVIYLLFIMWFSYPLVRTLHNVRRWQHDGINIYNPAILPEKLQEYRNPEPAA